MKVKTINAVDVKSKTVFVRVDFNVPIKEGKVADATRIKGALPTIKHLVSGGARVVLASHLGRPKGEFEERFSLRPVATDLSARLGQSVGFAANCIGEEATEKKSSLEDGQVLLLENLRFNSGEKKNDSDFAEDLASGIDVYVNDAFGTAHRAHASTAGITQFVDNCVAGMLLEKELEVLGNVVSDPDRPFVAILGGAKVSDKIPVIKSLIEARS